MSKEERSEIMQDALQYLDDEMIEEVENLRGFVETDAKTNVQKLPQKNKYWKKWTALAASICLLFVGSWIYEAYLQPVDTSDKMTDINKESDIEHKDDESAMHDVEDDVEDFQEEIEITDGIGSPESANEESLKGNIQGTVSTEVLNQTDDYSGDKLGFFVLNGRSYIQYEFQQDYEKQGADFVGAYVGHITGTMNGCTIIDRYAEGTGTYTGNVYEIKGISPELMLCMVWENGWVETFVHCKEITLCKGSDLVDDWLDLRNNYDAIALETIKNHQFVYESLKLTEEEKDAFDRLLDAFAEGDYAYVKEKNEHPFGGDMDTSDMLDFYFVKENGVRLRFRTLGDGYVSFPWLEACVKIDQNIYDEVVEILLRQSK